MTKKIEISAPELEKEIVEFLTDRATESGGKHTEPGCNLVHGYSCVLATCHDNMPRATPLDFFSDGTLSVWITAEPGGKIANIMRNPNVSIGFYERLDHSVEQKSMQMWGTAEIVNLKNNPELFDEKWVQFGLDEATAGLLEENMAKGLIPEGPVEQIMTMIRSKINMLKITPTKVALLCMRPDALPQKKMWEEGRAFMNKLSA